MALHCFPGHQGNDFHLRRGILTFWTSSLTYAPVFVGRFQGWALDGCFSLNAVFKGSRLKKVSKKNGPIVKGERRFLISKQDEMVSRALLLETRGKQFFLGS